MLSDRERGPTEDLSFTEIAMRIWWDPSVVSREVARHGAAPGISSLTCAQASLIVRFWRRPGGCASQSPAPPAPTVSTPVPPTSATYSVECSRFC
jgi:hypothetical protein